MATTYLRRVDPISLAKVMSIGLALFGFIVGAFFALFAVAGAGIGAALSESTEPLFGVLFGVGAVVILPVVYAILGFFTGLLYALVFNAAMRWTGGLQIDLG